MRTVVERPKAAAKKINSKNEFELCYIRHQYLRKVFFNPSGKTMAPYYGIVTNLAKRTFRTYRGLFQTTGFEIDDLVNVGKIHLVSYLGLFSIEVDAEKHDKFVDVFYRTNGEFPTGEDLLNKDKADFTCFLKQRMEDVVRVCRQKARNIKGLLTDEYVVVYGPTAPPELHILADDYDKYGYRKLDINIFKTLKKRMGFQKGPVYEFNGLFYVTLPVDHRSLTLDDFISAGFDPYESQHNLNPLQVLEEIDSQRVFEMKKKSFFSRSKTYQNRKIKEFISLHEKDPRYTDEIRAARKLLKRKVYDETF
jgi:hypothetical protein